MGIKGLLPYVEQVTTDFSAKDLAGLRIGVDTYAWLHRSIGTCALELGLGRPTDKYLKYCIRCIEALLAANVAKVLLVLDGADTPCKAVNEDRAKSREEHRRKAQQHFREGNLTEAHNEFRASIDITPAMGAELIFAVRARWGNSRERVDWLVAPYEADAQLAFLSREGIIDAVLSEDGDMLPAGVQRLLCKWNKDTCQGRQIRLRDVMAMTSKSKTSLDFRSWTEDMFLRFCILCGCDYLANARGVGVVAAHGIVWNHRNRRTRADMERAIVNEIALSKKQLSGDDKIVYRNGLARAFLAFRHQRVYDPRDRSVKPVTPFEPESLEALLRLWNANDPTAHGTGKQRGVKSTEAAVSSPSPLTESSFSPDEFAAMTSFLGVHVPSEVATEVADGFRDPSTHQLFQDLGPKPGWSSASSTGSGSSDAGGRGSRGIQQGLGRYFPKAGLLPSSKRESAPPASPSVAPTAATPLPTTVPAPPPIETGERLKPKAPFHLAREAGSDYPTDEYRKRKEAAGLDLGLSRCSPAPSSMELDVAASVSTSSYFATSRTNSSGSSISGGTVAEEDFARPASTWPSYQNNAKKRRGIKRRKFQPPMSTIGLSAPAVAPKEGKENAESSVNIYGKEKAPSTSELEQFAFQTGQNYGAKRGGKMMSAPLPSSSWSAAARTSVLQKGYRQKGLGPGLSSKMVGKSKILQTTFRRRESPISSLSLSSKRSWPKPSSPASATPSSSSTSDMSRETAISSIGNAEDESPVSFGSFGYEDGDSLSPPKPEEKFPLLHAILAANAEGEKDVAVDTKALQPPPASSPSMAVRSKKDKTAFAPFSTAGLFAEFAFGA